MPYLAQSTLTPILDEDQVPEPPQNYIPGSTYVPPVGAPVEAVGAGAPVPEPVVVEQAPATQPATLPPANYQPGSTYVPPSQAPLAYPEPTPAPAASEPYPASGFYTDSGAYMPLADGQGNLTYQALDGGSFRPGAPTAVPEPSAPVAFGQGQVGTPLPSTAPPLGLGRTRGYATGMEFAPSYVLPANRTPQQVGVQTLPAGSSDNWAAPPINHETPIQNFPENVIQRAQTIPGVVGGALGSLLMPVQSASAEELEAIDEADQLPRPVTGGFRGSSGGGRAAPTGGGGAVEQPVVVPEPAPTTPRPAPAAAAETMPTLPGTAGAVGGARTTAPSGTGGLGAPEAPPAAPPAAAAAASGGGWGRSLLKKAALPVVGGAGLVVAMGKGQQGQESKPGAPSQTLPGRDWQRDSTHPNTPADWAGASTRSLELMRLYNKADYDANVQIATAPGSDGVPRKLWAVRGMTDQDGNPLIVGIVRGGETVPMGVDINKPEDVAAMIDSADPYTGPPVSTPAPNGGGTTPAASGGSSGGSAGGGASSGGRSGGGSGSSSGRGSNYDDYGSRSSGGSSRRSSFDDTADYQREYTADDFLDQAGGDRKKAAALAKQANKRRRSKKGGSRGGGGMFWEGFPFNRPPTPIRQHVLDALAASRNKTR